MIAGILWFYPLPDYFWNTCDHGTVKGFLHRVTAMSLARRVLHCSRNEDAAAKKDHGISLILDDTIGRGGVSNRRVQFLKMV